MSKPEEDVPPVDIVDTNAVEALIQTKEIGSKIRRLRLKRSMGLHELGEQVDLSASFLSQLETGRVVPTMRNLARIALALKKDIAYFLVEEEAVPVFRVSHAKDRIRLQLAEKEVLIATTDSLGMLLQDGKTVPTIADLMPGDIAYQPPVFAGMELLFVIHGSLEIATEGRVEVLQAEDSAWIDGNTQRNYRCLENKPARLFIMNFESHIADTAAPQ